MREEGGNIMVASVRGTTSGLLLQEIRGRCSERRRVNLNLDLMMLQRLGRFENPFNQVKGLYSPLVLGPGPGSTNKPGTWPGLHE